MNSYFKGNGRKNMIHYEICKDRTIIISGEPMVSSNRVTTSINLARKRVTKNLLAGVSIAFQKVNFIINKSNLTDIENVIISANNIKEIKLYGSFERTRNLLHILEIASRRCHDLEELTILKLDQQLFSKEEAFLLFKYLRELNKLSTLEITGKYTWWKERKLFFAKEFQKYLASQHSKSIRNLKTESSIGLFLVPSCVHSLPSAYENLQILNLSCVVDKSCLQTNRFFFSLLPVFMEKSLLRLYLEFVHTETHGSSAFFHILGMFIKKRVANHLLLRLKLNVALPLNAFALFLSCIEKNFKLGYWLNGKIRLTESLMPTRRKKHVPIRRLIRQSVEAKSIGIFERTRHRIEQRMKRLNLLSGPVTYLDEMVDASNFSIGTSY
eukprot:snap_masked-scaffold_56-processed-gene-1.46-mRNA-1 protein AED:1.00 eAED:1.00 QI:0/-1/0/0/-1/1/1/0/382